MTASVEISPEMNLEAVAMAAGQPDPDKRRYRDGGLYVEAVTQEDLETAAAAASPQSRRALTYAEFKERFTADEMAAVRQAVLADTTGQALDWTLDAASSNTVNLDSPNCGAFLDKMAGAGIITASRKAEILA